MPRNGNGSYSLPASSWNPAVDSTIIDASDWNTNVAADLEGALTQSISKDGQTVYTGNQPMGNNKFTGLAAGAVATDSVNLGQVQGGAYEEGTPGGTADAITLTVSPVWTSYTKGKEVWFTATGTNTGATTAAVSGLAARDVQANGVALVAGDIVSGRYYGLRDDGTQFQLLTSHATVMHTADIADAAITAPKLATNAQTGAVRAVTGTTDTILSTDRGKLITYSNGSPIAVTVPQATGDFASPFYFSYVNLGVGTVTFTPTTSTIDGAATLTATTGQGGEIYSNSTNYFSQRGSTATATIAPPVRQTVLSGPVSTDGLSAFGGSTGSSTVTMSGTLIATASNGFSSSGPVDRIGSITNASWTGLTTTGVMYLYLDVNSDGTCTAGSGTLAPTYRWGGADVVTSGQFTFNIQEMIGKVGNGATAAQTYRVYVGEVDVAGSVTTAIRWYQLMGRYLSPFTNTLPAAATAVTFNHNLGTNVITGTSTLVIECITNDSPFVVGDRFVLNIGNIGGSYIPYTGAIRRNSTVLTTASTTPFYLINASTGGLFTPDSADWKYAYQLERGW